MSDYVTGLLVIFSEVGLLLLLAMIIIIIVTLKHRREKKKLALELVEKIKQQEGEHINKLVTLLKEKFGFDDDGAAGKADSLIKSEKDVYLHILNIFLGHEREELSEFDDCLNSLLNEYYALFESDEEGRGDAESLIVKARKENQQLREEKAQLRGHLDVAMTTMENMMGEYASMYEGGQEGADERVKSEMYELKKKLDDMPLEEGNEADNTEAEFDTDLKENLLADDGSIPELSEDAGDSPEKAGDR